MQRKEALENLKGLFEESLCELQDVIDGELRAPDKIGAISEKVKIAKDFFQTLLDHGYFDEEPTMEDSQRLRNTRNYSPSDIIAGLRQAGEYPEGN